MSDFQLDTSGAIEMRRDLLANGVPAEPDRVVWPELTPFEQGYVEALLVEAWREIQGNFGRPTGFPFCRLAPSALERTRKDCAARFSGWVEHPNNTYVRADDVVEGQRFWRDRQSGVCTDFPPLSVFLDNDGLVNVREAV
jgi:hypothetical protein